MAMKKVLGLLMSAAMTTGLLAGCGSTQEAESTVQKEESKVSVSAETQQSTETEGEEAVSETGRISEETITVTIAGLNNYSDNVWNDTLQFAEYESRLGIKFDGTSYSSEQWKSKFSLMLASDELPDMVVVANMKAQDVETYGKEGYFLDLSQYLDIMPNFSAILEEYPEYAAAIKSDDGAIYALATLNTGDAVGMIQPVFINTKWLDNLDLEVPETLDDLYNVLKAFKEQDANGNGDPSDEIPLGYSDKNTRAELPILWAHGIYSSNEVYHLMVDENNKVSFGDISEKYKDFLKYMHKLYAEGLINEDAYVITGEEILNLFLNDQVGIFRTNSQLSGTPQERVNNYDILPGFTSEYSTEHVTVVGNRVGGGYNIAVNANTEYPEEIAKFIDYLYTEEGFISARFGYEGVTFDYVDVAGVPMCDSTAYEEAYTGTISYDYVRRAVDVFTIMSTDAGGSFYVLPRVSDEDLYSEEIVELAGQNVNREEMLRREDVEVVNEYPAVIYTDEELNERAILYSDITNYLKAAKAEFIVGEKDIESTWDAHIAELNSMGLDRLLEIEQAAYDRYIAK